VLSRVPVRDIVKIREDEHESFEKFRDAITKAIQVRIEAGDVDPSIIARKIEEELIMPATNDIANRLKVARRALERKGGTSFAVGATITTIGLISGVPLIAGAGIAAIGSSLPAAHKYLDDKGSIELSDMYFLWRLEEKSRKPSHQ
jgi:hypothetical protein